jgi:hypothetical protein
LACCCRSASDASRLLQRLEYRWDTKLATQLEAKILGPMAYSRALAKPLLVITITDGEPSDKPQDKIVSVIQECRARLAPRYGPNAVAFQFAQVRGQSTVLLLLVALQAWQADRSGTSLMCLL